MQHWLVDLVRTCPGPKAAVQIRTETVAFMGGKQPHLFFLPWPQDLNHIYDAGIGN